MSVTRTGLATRAGTAAYAETFGKACGTGHFSEFPGCGCKLSSLGIGTFGGAADDATDAAITRIVTRGLLSGINVIDTAAHYRYGRSARAAGKGLQAAQAQGVAREQVFLVGKGGFLNFPHGRPDDFDAWFQREVTARGLGERGDLAGIHLLTPQHIAMQFEQQCEALGVGALDAFLVDQPEIHITTLGKEQLNRKLLGVFEWLEGKVREGRLGCYGIATFHGMRVETDAAEFESLASMLGLAEKAAKAASGVATQGTPTHHFRIVSLPFNQAMTEGFTRFSQTTGEGSVVSTLQAAHQLGIYVLGSHTLAKGQLAGQCSDAVRAALLALGSDARRALQFARSTPGIGTALVGLSQPAHLDDVLAVAQLPPMARNAYVALYARAD